MLDGKKKTYYFFIFFCFFLFLVDDVFAQNGDVVVALPKNISQDKDIDWISRTFGRAIHLELKKDSLPAQFIEEEKFPSSDFIVLSKFKRGKDGRRIVFYINILSKQSGFIKGKDYYIIDSFAFSFLPEVIYEAKTYVSRMVRLYISSVAKAKSKFNPIKYNFPQDSINKISDVLAKLKVGEKINSNFAIENIVSDPSQVGLWFYIGVDFLEKGRIHDGLSCILRFLMKKGPDFITENEFVEDERVKVASDILSILLPGKSAKRLDAVKIFTASQFYRDFSDNELSRLSMSLESDPFMWPAMRRIGEINFARGNFRESLQSLRDYISTSNESFEFILTFSKVVSFVDELARGF
ncbi:hypothetical protein HRbin19_01268 [bacterium HR19]|nr:hypothetical protein HRbin19_01268 [bacterium HR19]